MSLAVFLTVALAVCLSVPGSVFQWCGYFLAEHLAMSLVLSLAVFLGVCLFVSINFSGVSLLVCQAVSLAWFGTVSLTLWLCH